MNKSAYLSVCFGAIIISFAPIFTRVSSVGPTETAFYRCFLAGILIFAYSPFLVNSRTFKQSKFDLPSTYVFSKVFSLKYWLPGLFFAIDLFLWHKSILFSGAGLATIL